MIFPAQRTIYGQDLALAQSLGLEYNMIPNTTLNEKLGVLPQVEKPAGVYPIIRYLTIGCGGQSIIDNPTTYPYSVHHPTDASPFKIMPFIIRERDRDLTFAERQKYRLRKELVVDGNNYVAYYLKVLVPDKDIIYRSDVVQFSKTISPFSFTDRDVLNPVPISKIDKITSNSSVYIAKFAKIVFELKEEEVREIDNVFTVMRNVLFPGYAGVLNNSITELGLCSGIDQTAQDGSIESICTQVAHHIDVSFDIDIYLNSKTSFYKTFELGGTEPLFMQ